MTAAAKKGRPEPFAHAADLPAAYRELAAAITALVKLEQEGPVPYHADDACSVTGLSPHAIWVNADAKVAAWQRLGAAARRVHVAKVGPSAARRGDRFRRLRVA